MMTQDKALTFVEIDILFCSRMYGVAPCTAAIGVTGDVKCFNCASTCQDTPNFDGREVTLRFAIDTDYLAASGIEAIPSLVEAKLTPAIVSLGEDLGQRAVLTMRFKDHPHSDTGAGYDKYLADRDYDPWSQGTYWGKFRARQPYLLGRSVRLIRGFLGQALADMETHHYVGESFDGPSPAGEFTIIATDILKLADDERAQAPALSTGYLSAGINSSVTACSLLPAAVGAEYPSSGTFYVAIGGKEICAATRSGDNLTLTRGQLGTTAAAHDAEDRVQLCLRYVAADPADIISDLLQTYAGVDASWIPLAAWKTETANFLVSVYTATIAEPTSVNKLLSELVTQCALALWQDDRARQIKLQVLRAIATDVDRFTEDNMMEGSLTIQEQPERRLSEVWTYYGQINPLLGDDDAENFRSTEKSDPAPTAENYDAPVIKKIFSRWIPAFGRSVAARLNEIQIGRFSTPPRRIKWNVFRERTSMIGVGTGYQLAARSFQDATGASVDVPVQAVCVNPEAAHFEIETEEMRFSADPIDLTNRIVVISGNVNNFDFRATHDTLYPALVGGETITCIVEAGVIVGSDSRSLNAFVVGAWPGTVTVKLLMRGRIQGAGGPGGAWTSNPGGRQGGGGGPALYTRQAIQVTFEGGQIYSGAGGGAADYFVSGGGGGGGAGQVPGVGGVGYSSVGGAGTTEAGGGGSASAPAGGNPGQDGGSIGPDPGGAAGLSIDGYSYVTLVGTPDVRGPTAN